MPSSLSLKQLNGKLIWRTVGFGMIWPPQELCSKRTQWCYLPRPKCLFAIRNLPQQKIIMSLFFDKFVKLSKLLAMLLKERAGGFGQTPFDGPGELAAALDDFDERILMNPLSYNEVRTRPILEEMLESIISGAALMADSSCTRDERRERIVAECNAVRQALQDLLTEYMANTGKKQPSESLEKAIDHMTRKTKDLRRQLRKAVIDHVSDSFVEDKCPSLDTLRGSQVRWQGGCWRARHHVLRTCSQISWSSKLGVYDVQQWRRC